MSGSMTHSGTIAKRCSRRSEPSSPTPSRPGSATACVPGSRAGLGTRWERSCEHDVARDATADACAGRLTSQNGPRRHHVAPPGTSLSRLVIGRFPVRIRASAPQKPCSEGLFWSPPCCVSCRWPQSGLSGGESRAVEPDRDGIEVVREQTCVCLLDTSDAADEEDSVDL